MVANLYKFLLAVIALVFAVLGAYAESAEFRFEDYRVESVFTGPNHVLVGPSQSDDKWMAYRRNALMGDVNFAGHYIIYTGGCGGGAICGEIVDAKTGKIVGRFPNAYQLDSPDGNYYDADFRPWIRLLIISGVAADPEIDKYGKPLSVQYRIRYFELKGGELVLIGVEN